MLRKVSKTIIKIFLWIIGIFITLDLLVVLLLFIPPVQQFTLLKVSKILTNITGGEITVEKIYLTPSLTLIAKNLAIKDHHYQNMISATTLKGKINLSKTAKGQLCLSFAQLDGGEVVIRKYKGEDNVNIAIWAKEFKKQEKKEEKFKLLFDRIKLRNVRFAYINDDKRQYRNDSIIDYAFFELQHINLDVDDFMVRGPDISCRIKALTLSQYTGFQLSGFSGDFRISPQGLVLDSLYFITPNSTFTGDFAFRYSDFHDYADFVNKIYFDTQVKCASVDMQDVIYFAPKLKGMENKLIFSGHIGGNINHLQTQNVYLKYKLQTFISGNFSIDNILDFKNSNLDLNFKDAHINLSELTQFKFPQGKRVTFPKEIEKINYAKIQGSYKGSLTKFNTDLVLQTNMGNVDMEVSTIPEKNSISYSGTLVCSSLNVGKLLNQPRYFNTVNFETIIEGHVEYPKNIAELWKSFSIKTNGKITHIDICGYPVKEVYFSGNYLQHKATLLLNSTDPLVSFSMKGTGNFENELPKITASLSKVTIKLHDIFSYYPYPLDSISAAGFEKLMQQIQQKPNLICKVDSVVMDMYGNKFENFNGFLGIDNAKLTDGQKTSRIDWFRLNAINKQNLPHQYQIHSNAVNLSLKTTYNVRDLISVIKNAAYYHLPVMFVDDKKFVDSKNFTCNDSIQFADIDIQFFYSRNLFDLIVPKLDIARNSAVSIHLGKTRSQDSFNFSFPQINYSGFAKCANLKATGNINNQEQLEINLQCDPLTLYQKTGSLNFPNINIHTVNSREELQFALSWRNPDIISINELNHFSGVIAGNAYQDFSLKIIDSKLFFRNSSWQFIGNRNTIHFENHNYSFDQCVLSSKVGTINVNGDISKFPNKECNILLEDFDISLLNSITAQRGFSFGGNMSLMATITANMEYIMVEGKTFVKEFVFNEEYLGDLFLDATVLDEGKLYFFGGILPSNGHNIEFQKFTYLDYLNLPNRNIEINGKFVPNLKELRVHAEMDTLKLGFMSPFLSSFSDMVSGYASGDLDFVMNPDSLYFDGKVRVKNAQLGIAPLNTTYYIVNQDILFNREGIDFNHVTLKDKFNNEAKLSGYLSHNKFKDFKIDLSISSSKIMILNTPKKADAPFYGDGFISGDISIQGDTKQLSFSSHNIKTLPGSAITFPLSSASSVSSSQGIYFVQSNISNKLKLDSAKKSTTALNFDFIFDITKDTDVRLDLEPIDGILKCKTSGKLHLTHHSTSGNLNLDGILSIISGKFHMSLKNFFPRDFAIVEGGTISFAGPLSTAQINVSALYQKTTSLNSLIPELNIGRTDVLAYLGLNGNLMNPNPTFSFAFPRLTADEQMNVFAALDTVNLQNGIRQFFSFVFLNTFITNMDPMNQTVGTGVDFVSGILTSFLSNLSNNFSIGVNYNNQENYKEYSVNAAMSFDNDRFMLKTNLGYASNPMLENTNNFVGEVSFDYEINENWRLRAFYFNDKVNNQEAIVTSKPQQGGGIGITFQQEFNNRKDFLESWLPKKKEKKQKKETPQINKQ